MLLYKQERLTSVGISKNEFWSNSYQFDSVCFMSKGIINRFENNFKAFRVTKFEDINYQVAFIRYNNETKDTVYSDRFFQFWEINKTVYEDTSRYFEKLLANYFNK